MAPKIDFHHEFAELTIPSIFLPLGATSLFLASASALAQSATIAEPPGVGSSAIVQMLLALGLIIGLLFAGAFLLRKLNGGHNFGQNGPLKIIGGLMISPRERIVLIEIENDWLVVGVVPGQIKTLHTLAKGELPPNKKNEIAFGQWLKQVTERNKTHEK